MKKVFIVLFILGITVPPISHAGDLFNANIIHVRLDYTGWGVITFDQPIPNTPACVKDGYDNAVGFHIKTEEGRALYTMALVAKLNGTKVSVRSGGHCTAYVDGNSVVGDFEIVAYLWSHNF